jgi:aspartate kinase
MATKIIAQKFGGTSVATPESRRLVVNHIRRAISAGYSPVVVVSAIGRRGSPYASDTLLDLIHGEGEPVAARDADLIFQCGEIISVALMSHLLKLCGLPAVGLTGGQARIYSDGRYRRGKIVRIDPTRLLRHVRTGEIPVVTGGQGTTVDDGEVTLLGRGASDTSGVAVGVAVGAEKVEIYTDVSGVAIADPDLVPEARFLEEISYRKLYEMGVFGAEVMHPGAVMAGQEGGLQIVCRSTFDAGPGTRITETENEPPLVGISRIEPVELLVLPESATEGACDQRELYDYFAAAAIREEGQGKTVVAVSSDWRAELEDDLASRGIGSEDVLSDMGLVSMIGKPEFIAQSYQRASSVVASLDISARFQERAGIRCTFAVPSGQASRLVRALYREFCE